MSAAADEIPWMARGNPGQGNRGPFGKIQDIIPNGRAVTRQPPVAETGGLALSRAQPLDAGRRSALTHTLVRVSTS
jgi:hypothetical protein